MKEIEAKDLMQYINPMDMEKHPAIICAADGKETNAMTIGWAGFGTLWRKKMATVYIHAQRYSKHIFDGAEYYSICFFSDEYRPQLGYFGRVSGRDEDKMKNGGLTVCSDGPAPYFAESSVVVFCRVMGRSDFDAQSCDEGVKDWYAKDGVHTQYYGEIVKVLAAEA